MCLELMGCHRPYYPSLYGTGRAVVMQAAMTGTVVVTGADGQVGRAFLQRLSATQTSTVALTRRPAEVPAHRQVTGALDAPAAIAALQEAEYVVHLAGTLRPLHGNSYQHANVETTQAVASALHQGQAKRILFLSYVGASASSRNPYLRTKAIAERLLAATGKELVVFRCTHILGSPEEPGPTALALLAQPGRGVMVLGTGRQRSCRQFRGIVHVHQAHEPEQLAPHDPRPVHVGIAHMRAEAVSHADACIPDEASRPGTKDLRGAKWTPAVLGITHPELPSLDEASPRNDGLPVTEHGAEVPHHRRRESLELRCGIRRGPRRLAGGVEARHEARRRTPAVCSKDQCTAEANNQESESNTRKPRSQQ